MANEAIDRIHALREEVGRVVVGQQGLIDGLIIGLLCNQHVLIEGVPGLAKTLAVTTLARALRASFQRIQFTPDLLPADLVGTLIYQPRTGDFTVRKGPIFNQVILADEINRAPAKVQSAMLEAMQERHVTIGEETFPLGGLFMVLATQNPIEHEGTYPLPEAQVDRFMLKLKVTYPSMEDERVIVRRMAHSAPDLQVAPVLSPEEIAGLRECVDAVYLDEKMEEYILRVVQATRTPHAYGLDVGKFILYGASPRASIYLAMASRAHAFLGGREFVSPHDVKSVAMDILRHRVIVSYEAEAEERTPEDLIQAILENMEIPV